MNCIFRDLTLFKDKINTDLLSNWGFHYTAIKYHMLRYNVINLIPTVLPIFFFRCFAVLPICIVVSIYFWENTLIAYASSISPEISVYGTAFKLFRKKCRAHRRHSDTSRSLFGGRYFQLRNAAQIDESFSVWDVETVFISIVIVLQTGFH